MWRHDRGGERPVDCGHEPLRLSAHAEGAEEQSHSDGYLLAWQPGVDLETGFESNIFLFQVLGRRPFSCIVFLVVRSWSMQGPKPLRLSFCYYLSSFPKVSHISFSWETAFH